MPPTYSPCPRPILKHNLPSSSSCYSSNYPSDSPSPSHESTESTQLLAIDPSILSSLVRFPPSQVLTHSFPAIPASAYDRSPIVVSPNMCSLPERGCPGRTYLPSGGPNSGKGLSAGSNGRSFLRGKHLHPRAARFDSSSLSAYNAYSNSSRDEDSNSTEDDPTPKATPTSYHRPLPPLIPDLSSSSSGSSSSSSSEEEYDVRFMRDSEDGLDFSSLHISPKSKPSLRPRTPYSSYPPSPTSPTSPLYGSHPPYPSHPHPNPAHPSHSPNHLSPSSYSNPTYYSAGTSPSSTHRSSSPHTRPSRRTRSPAASRSSVGAGNGAPLMSLSIPSPSRSPSRTSSSSSLTSYSSYSTPTTSSSTSSASKKRPSKPKVSRPSGSSSSSKGTGNDVVLSPLEPRYKTFGADEQGGMLTECTLPVGDGGCFGGF